MSQELQSLRSIPNAYRYIKELDPDSEITLYFIRKIAKQKLVSTLESGSKIMIYMDSLLEFLSGKTVNPINIKV